MSTKKYKVGDTLYRVSRGTSYDQEVTIDRVGRKWLYSGRERIDPETLIASIEGYGAVAQFYPDKATYEAKMERMRAWARLRQKINDSYATPAHLTTEQIDGMRQAIEERKP